MGDLMADIGTILPILKDILLDVHKLTSGQLTDIATNVDKLIETNSIMLERLLNRVDHIAANIDNVTSAEAGDAKVAIRNVREITESIKTLVGIQRQRGQVDRQRRARLAGQAADDRRQPRQVPAQRRDASPRASTRGRARRGAC